MWNIQLVNFVADRGSLEWLLTRFGRVAIANDVVISGVLRKSGIAIKSFFGFDSLKVMARTSEVYEELLANGYLSIVKDEGFRGGGVRLIFMLVLVHWCVNSK